MKKPILTLADDQLNVAEGQLVICKQTGHRQIVSIPFKDYGGKYDVYDVELIEEIPEAEKMKSVVSDEEILSKANDFYKKPPNKYPGPTYTDLDLGGDQ